MRKTPETTQPGATETDLRVASSILDGIVLPSDLVVFAAEEVAAGRHRDVSAVVRAGLVLLRQRVVAKAELLTCVLAAQEEGERAGYLSGDEVAMHVRAVIGRRAGAIV